MGTKVNPKTLRIFHNNSITVPSINWYSNNYSTNLLKDVRRLKYIEGIDGLESMNSGEASGEAHGEIAFINDNLVWRQRTPTGITSKRIAELVGQLIQNAKSPESAFKKAGSMLGQRLVGHSNIMGLKIRSAGRFNGALMAKSATLSYGKMPLQSISVNIDYDQIAVITKYGLQSVSVWLAKS